MAANRLRTGHPVPGLPFTDDERLPLDHPDASGRTGRDQGEGLRGRTDPLPGGGWVPDHGRTVVLITDGSGGGLHHDRLYGHTGVLYRHGGYRCDGTTWHRPGMVFDGAYERYAVRPVQDAHTVTAADLLVHPAGPGRAQAAAVAGFNGHQTALPDWRAHLALWAGHRRRAADPRPLEECAVDLKAPEPEPSRLVDRAGPAKIANMPEEELPHPRYAHRDLPEPQARGAGGPLRSPSAARDRATSRPAHTGLPTGRPAHRNPYARSVLRVRGRRTFALQTDARRPRPMPTPARPR
ncbi:hypothetical protein ACFWFZ_31255 [Streptomyces sp. NPDC060232]|uniref:hypothetical protein n=1 Tax=Streptomyces sp. NPDC060232 TaxID=3347079 RepID=UPI003658DAB9